MKHISGALRVVEELVEQSDCVESITAGCDQRDVLPCMSVARPLPTPQIHTVDSRLQTGNSLRGDIKCAAV